MKSFKKNTLVLLLLIVPLMSSKSQTMGTLAAEQSSYAPTPQTQAFLRYGNNAVEKNSGTSIVNIPVYTYKDNDFEFPISVTYSSQGFTPGCQTGILGLGWFLNCGGSISREINGVPDDRTSPDGTKGILLGRVTYSDSDVMNMNKGNLNSMSLQHYVIDGRETTSDVYHFIFNGHSGTFHFDSEKHVHVYNTGGNHGTYTITPVLPQNGELRGFIIKTGDGYEYTFGTGDDAVFLNTVERSIGGEFSGSSIYTINSPVLTANPIVTWNITKIKAPNGRTVTFEYQNVETNISTYISPETDNNPFLVITFTPGFLQRDNFGAEHYRNVSIVQTTYLSRILVKDAAEISFQMSLKECADRPVTPDVITSFEQDHFITQVLKKVDSIKVRNRDGKIVHSTGFSYKIKDNRLLLTQVHTDGIGDYRMSYHEEFPFPAISTADTDFWGFYNGKGNDYSVVSSTIVNSDYNDCIETDAKNPNWHYSRLGCLRRIIYPTSGFTMFEYEANRADEILLKRKYKHPSLEDDFDEDAMIDDESQDIVNDEDKIAYLVGIYPYSILFGENDECGGVRLANTTDYDNHYGYKSRSYTYTGGIVNSFPKHNSAELHSLQIYNPFLEYPVNSLDNPHICYSSVCEMHSDGSYTVTRYNDYHTHPDEYVGQLRKKNNMLDNVPYSYSPAFINNILRMPNSNHSKRGKVNSIKYYNSDDELVKHTAFKYEMHDSAYTAYVVTSGKYFASVKRYTGDYRVVTMEEREYYKETCFSTIHEYEYDNLGRIECNTTIAPGNKIKHIKTLFHNDTVRHLYNQPSRILTVLENDTAALLVDAVIYNYTLFGDMHLPYKINRTQIPDGLRYPCDIDSLSYTTLQSLLYDSLGNPVEIKDQYGTPTAILWGYGGMYPIAKAYGMEYQELRSLVSPGSTQHIDIALDDEQRSRLLDSTPALVDVYEYEPLVGVSKHYTPNGNCTNYKYDTYGRLIGVDDGLGKLKEYDYIQYSDSTIQN